MLAGADRPAMLLLAAWIGYRLYPYIPTLDFTKYWHAIRPVLLDPLPHGSDPFRLCLAWLLCCMLVEATAGAARTVRLFPILAGAIFAAKVLIVDNTLASADIAGATVAYVLWLLLFRRAPARNAILAAFIAALLVAMRAEPLHGLGLAVLLEKAYLYGGLIWLLTRAGMRLLFATLAAVALLLVAAMMASHGAPRPAVLLNPAVALGAGALFASASFSRLRRSKP
jgi:hypothetical protein